MTAWPMYGVLTPDRINFEQVNDLVLVDSRILSQNKVYLAHTNHGW